MLDALLPHPVLGSQDLQRVSHLQYTSGHTTLILLAYYCHTIGLLLDIWYTLSSTLMVYFYYSLRHGAVLNLVRTNSLPSLAERTRILLVYYCHTIRLLLDIWYTLSGTLMVYF